MIPASVHESDRTREFEIRWQATQFVKMFRTLAGDGYDPQRLREAAVVFASSAGLAYEDAGAFVTAVTTLRWIPVAEFAGAPAGIAK